MSRLTCSLARVDGDHLHSACDRPATLRLTSSTDPWPQQYACAEHADVVAPELDVREPI